MPRESTYIFAHVTEAVEWAQPAVFLIKPHSARTGPVFSQLSAAVVRHKANDGVVHAIRAWYDTTLSAVV